MPGAAAAARAAAVAVPAAAVSPAAAVAVRAAAAVQQPASSSQQLLKRLKTDNFSISSKLFVRFQKGRSGLAYILDSLRPLGPWFCCR